MCGASLPDSGHPDQAAVRLLAVQKQGQAALDSLQDALTDSLQDAMEDSLLGALTDSLQDGCHDR